MNIQTDRREYFKAYHYARKDLRDARKKAWREKNSAREKAHDRLRHLRNKKELSEGEVAQCAEIVARYPKRRFYYGRSS